MRAIHVSGLMDMNSRQSESAAKKGENEREDDTQNNRRRERKVKAEAAPPHVDVARQASERQAEHHEDTKGGDREANQYKRLTQALHHIRASNQLDPGE